MTWFYDYMKDEKTQTTILIRRYKVKWWDGFKMWDKVDESSVFKWIQNNSTIVPVMPQTPFLHDKGFLMSSMSKTTSARQMKEVLEKALASLNESSSDSVTDSGSHHSGNTNEDDCYGIDLAEP